MQNFLGDEIKIPFIVNRNYFLPSFVNENTLLIVSSYSGNTEESISVFNEALNTDAQLFVSAQGERLRKFLQKKIFLWLKLFQVISQDMPLDLVFFHCLKYYRN